MPFYFDTQEEKLRIGNMSYGFFVLLIFIPAGDFFPDLNLVGVHIEGNPTDMIHFVCQSTTKTVGCTVEFFINMTTLDNIRFTNKKCYDKYGACQTHICACSADCNQFTWNYTVSSKNSSSTFGCGARFENETLKTVYKARAYIFFDGIGFRQLDTIIIPIQTQSGENATEEPWTVDQRSLIIASVALTLVVVIIAFFIINKCKTLTEKRRKKDTAIHLNNISKTGNESLKSEQLTSDFTTTRYFPDPLNDRNYGMMPDKNLGFERKTGSNEYTEIHNRQRLMRLPDENLVDFEGNTGLKKYENIQGLHNRHRFIESPAEYLEDSNAKYEYTFLPQELPFERSERGRRDDEHKTNLQSSISVISSASSSQKTSQSDFRRFSFTSDSNMLSNTRRKMKAKSNTSSSSQELSECEYVETYSFLESGIWCSVKSSNTYANDDLRETTFEKNLFS